MDEEPAMLLIEDNPDDEALTIRALRMKGIANEIVVAQDGPEALEMLFGQRFKLSLPHVILLDLNLPKMDGVEVLREIRANPRTSHVPVVILTSSDEQRDMFRTYSLGANSFVKKPVEFEDFVAAIGELGIYWMLHNRQPETA